MEIFEMNFFILKLVPIYGVKLLLVLCLFYNHTRAYDGNLKPKT